MRGYQEQNCEGDLGGSPGHGWTGRPKADNILLVRWGVTFGIRAEDGSLLARYCPLWASQSTQIQDFHAGSPHGFVLGNHA